MMKQVKSLTSDSGKVAFTYTPLHPNTKQYEQTGTLLFSVVNLTASSHQLPSIRGPHILSKLDGPDHLTHPLFAIHPPTYMATYTLLHAFPLFFTAKSDAAAAEP
ncbi:hypothetical protein SESBI_05555 [Sesbania bispinosa]|nr:hypothetical protein SESBI_05555 [Sesbania bispinosa]